MKLISALILFVLAGRAAMADDLSMSAARSTLSAPAILYNRKYDDVHTLTDAKLRVDDGSLSRYSFKSKIIYRGPTLGDLSAPDQPNPDGSVGNYSQAIKGTLTTRYRLSPTRAISAGTGYVLTHPFHGMDRSYVRDPVVTYDMASRWHGMQLRNSPGFTLTTTPENLNTGEFGLATFDNSLAYSFGNRWTFTMDNNATVGAYKRSYIPGQTKKGGDGSAQEFSLSAFPGWKYSFTDDVFAYSGLQLQWFNPRSTPNKFALLNTTPYVRIGAAYVIDREIYLTPYLDAYLPHISANTTTLNFQTIFSVF